MESIDVVVGHETDYAAWQAQARGLIARGVPPQQLCWRVASAHRDLFATADGQQPGAGPTLTVPRRFAELAPVVALHRDPGRFALLYRLLWRIAGGERGLLAVATDPEVGRAALMARSVRRDIHKMKAFVRFRRMEDDGRTCYVAWFEPQHFVVEATAPFFADRFAGMRWSIITPDRSAHWDGQRLLFGAGASRQDAPTEDALEEYWRSYYASIFNPARLNSAAMKAQMSVRYWRNLPESRLIGPLVAAAGRRATDMVEAQPAPPGAAPRAVKRRTCAGTVSEDENPMPVDAGSTLENLRRSAMSCRDCPLWQGASSTVFGEGPAKARLMLVGEQPGDQEDIQGRPFVGPAGAILGRALDEAGIDRGNAYVTNAVKHFKFVVRGKRRLHQSPSVVEVDACRPWLDRELDLVAPEVVVALGATAARAVFRREMRINRNRGQVLALDGTRKVIVTVHPSYLLRLPDEGAKAAEYGRFVKDLRLARDQVTENTLPRLTAPDATRGSSREDA